MSERVCLRCDWTGGGDADACPRCGAPLYELGRQEPTEPGDDANAPPWEPAAAAGGKRWAVFVLAIVVAVGAFGFIRSNTPDPAAALGEVEVSQETPTVHETPSSVGPPSASTPASPTEPAACSNEPAAPAELEPEPATTAAVTADYRFQNSLASSVGTAPDLVEIGDGLSGFSEGVVLGQTRVVLTFDGGRGVSLAPTAAVIDSEEYTIELLFRFHRLRGYRKIIDFTKASQDCGLYSLDGRLSFYATAGASRATIEVDRYVQVVLTRDASARVVGYVDGVRQFSFRDTGELAVIDANDTLLFFRDDSTTDAEYSGGAVSRIRLYDRPLTRNEVAELSCAELPGACG